MNKIDLDLDFEDLDKDLEITEEEYEKLPKLAYYEFLLITNGHTTYCMYGDTDLYLVKNQVIIAVVEDFEGKKYVYDYIYSKFKDKLHCLSYLIISIDTIYHEWKHQLSHIFCFEKVHREVEDSELENILNKYAEAFK